MCPSRQNNEALEAWDLRFLQLSRSRRGRLCGADPGTYAGPAVGEGSACGVSPSRPWEARQPNHRLGSAGGAEVPGVYPAPRLGAGRGGEEATRIQLRLLPPGRPEVLAG